jgi:hypothetical protein
MLFTQAYLNKKDTTEEFYHFNNQARYFIEIPIVQGLPAIITLNEKLFLFTDGVVVRLFIL